ncbi:MAG TPA: DUF58 domain-containing protein [Roseimicrobium sp.]|nr:DUF58 domain-containing protein [Roseimicrobium sp.]
MSPAGSKSNGGIFKRYVYRNYWSYYAMKMAIRQRLTRGSVLVLLAIVFAGAMGADPNQSVAYQAFAFLALLTVAGMVASRFHRVRLSLSRTTPRYASVGQPVRYLLHVHNLTPRMQNGLMVLDEQADPRPTFEDFISIPEPGEEKRNWLDRRYGYYRWAWQLEQNERGLFNEANVGSLLGNGTADVEVELTPSRRGILRMGRTTIAVPDPTGLFRSLRRVTNPGQIIVLPKRYPITDLPLPGSSRYQQGGVALASSVGQSDEFVSLREYRPGDPMRHIHWRSWARTGKPIVKEYQDEHFVRHALILDTFAPHVGAALFEEAVSVAASFACTIQTQESLLDLMFVGPQAYCFTAGRGLAHQEQMLEILASVQVCRTNEFESLTRLVIEHASTVSGCMVVLLAWDEPRRELVRRLQALNVPVHVYVLVESGKAATVDASTVRLPPGDFHILERGMIAEQLSGKVPQP